MIVDVVRTAKYLKIARVYKLPLPGRVLVKEGMKLNPGDIIAEAEILSQVVMLDIAKGLGLSVEETKACLIREVDENLEEGDVIAQCEKTLPRLFRAPLDGKIISYHKGQMALATSTRKIAVHSKMIGKVEAIIPEYGGVISTQGTLIQGMWGNGLAGKGKINILDTSKSLSTLENLSSGQVIVGGNLSDAEFLTKCQEKEVAGLILPSITPDLEQASKAVPFPIISIHGFGKIPFSEDILALLRSRDGSVISVNACERDRISGERPEIIIPADEGNLDKELSFRKKLEVGDRVRMLSGKAVHQTGKVVEIFNSEQPFENGLILPTALVKLQSLEKIKVPQSNLLVIG